MSTRDRVLELIERGRRRLRLRKKPSSNRRAEMADEVHWVEQVH